MVPTAVITAAGVIPLALLIDRLIGDPRSVFHPVALAGRFIGFWGQPRKYRERIQRFAGVLFWLLTVSLFALPFFLVQFYAPLYLYLVIAPFLLKSCLAWRSLEEHTLAVVAALQQGIESGRKVAGMMVSRDTTALGREQILSAGYESLTENLTDSIVSPLIFFSFFGLAGAAVYRAANTMDAMLGYRDERVKIGWFPARMDDLLNYIPARITVIFLLLWFTIVGRAGPAMQMLRRDGHKRPGFNGGIVMAAMAGGCGIQFEKPGVYTIGDGGRSFDEAGDDIIRAVRAVTIMLAIFACSALILLGGLINSTGI